MEIEVTDDIRVAPESKNMIRILSEAFEKRTPIDINGKQYTVVAKSNSVFSMRRVQSVKAAEWNGEGLPPAGTVCEVDSSVGETGFATCTINYSSSDVIVWRHLGSAVEHCAYAGAREFRKIRTPEQIAAGEREERLIAMSHAYQDFTGESPSSAANQAFRALDLAGYRKQVKP